SDGYVHYKITGPQTGPVVVLVHGFSMPLFIYEPLALRLEEKGYRVLRIDLFGRGLSDRPDADYSPGLFTRQLRDVLGHLEISTPVRLVGTSMGGIVVSHFTLSHPEKVQQLVLIAPAGFPMEIPTIAKVTRLPGLGDYLMKTVG